MNTNVEQAWGKLQSFSKKAGGAVAEFFELLQVMVVTGITSKDLIEKAHGTKGWPTTTTKTGKVKFLGVNAAFEQKPDHPSIIAMKRFYTYTDRYRIAVDEKTGLIQADADGKPAIKAPKAKSATTPEKEKFTLTKKAVQTFLDKAVSDKKLADASYRKALVDFCAALNITVSIPKGK